MMSENQKYGLYFLAMGLFLLLFGLAWKNPKAGTPKAQKWGSVILGAFCILCGLNLLLKG